MRHFYYLFILIFFNCRSNSSIIKNKLDLSNQQFRQIKSIDSVLFLVSKGLNNNVKPARIRRRLDSFYLNSYTEGELKAMLLGEYIFRNDKNPDFELDRTIKPGEGFTMDGVDDGNKFMDSLVSKTLGMPKKVQDSLNRQNKKN